MNANSQFHYATNKNILSKGYSHYSSIRNYFYLYFIKSSPYWKMFWIKVVNLNDIYILGYVHFLCTISCYSESWYNWILLHVK
jgi:hypothetical protein